MAVPTIPVLGSVSLTRRYILEVNTGTTASPIWTCPGGVTNIQWQPSTPNLVTDTDQAGKGAQSQNKTGYSWSYQVTLKRGTILGAPVSYDPGQEFIRLAGLAMGLGNTVAIRISEFDPNDAAGVSTPRVEAFTGSAGVQWVPSGGDMDSEDMVPVTFFSQGALTPITHPYPATAAVPVITSLAIEGVGTTIGTAGGADLVHIFGNGFLGTVATSGVKFATTNSPRWTIVNDGHITAIPPAHAAGAVAVVVTNATGASTTGPTITYA